jgi:hypothetical protein
MAGLRPSIGHRLLPPRYRDGPPGVHRLALVCAIGLGVQPEPAASLVFPAGGASRLHPQNCTPTPFGNTSPGSARTPRAAHTAGQLTCARGAVPARTSCEHPHPQARLRAFPGKQGSRTRSPFVFTRRSLCGRTPGSAYPLSDDRRSSVPRHPGGLSHGSGWSRARAAAICLSPFKSRCSRQGLHAFYSRVVVDRQGVPIAVRQPGCYDSSLTLRHTRTTPATPATQS